VSAQRRGFPAFLAQTYAHEAETPLGIFAREFGPVLPAEGDRPALLAAVKAHAAEWDNELASWMPDCFSVAWRVFQPTCIEPGCSNGPCDEMSYCAEHVGAELL
jgi:hypothetical protein